MDIRTIKNDKYLFWTNHSKFKMLQYGISPAMVKKVLARPERIVEGIAPETIASMIRKDSKKSQRELWVMHQKNISAYGGKNKKSKIKATEGRIKIISAWIYPGVSPKGKEIYIPQDVWDEIASGNH
jgi:hypothetical protein